MDLPFFVLYCGVTCTAQTCGSSRGLEAMTCVVIGSSTPTRDYFGSSKADNLRTQELHHFYRSLIYVYKPYIIIRSVFLTRAIASYLKSHFPSMVPTRTKSYVYGDDSQESRRPGSMRELPSERRRRWAHFLREQNYQPLISEVLEIEIPKYENSTVISAANRITYMRDCALILASAPSVFAAAVDGTLVSRLMSDTDMEKQYATALERAHRQPSIYAHFLTDEYGKPPSAN